MEILLQKFEGRNLSLPPLPAPFITVTETQKHQFDYSKHTQKNVPQPFGITDVFEAKFSAFSTLVKGEDVKTVYEVDLEIQESDHKFLPGDTIGILTRNFDNEVNIVIDNLRFLDNCCDVPLKVGILPKTSKKNPKIPNFIPEIITIRKLLTECLDIRCIVKKLFLRSIIPYVKDEEEKRFLEILCSKEGASEYDNLIVKNGLHFVDFLRKYLKTCQEVPITVLMEHLPRLMPRPYSIANSQLICTNKIRIIFSKIDGLTTTLLENMGPLSLVQEISIPIYFRQRNNFVYGEEDLNRNIIMIGPGTGLAPFIGFMEHRSVQKPNSNGSMWLFVGCRYEDRSYFYQEQIEEFMKNGTLTKLTKAFSRDVPSDSKYVQDEIIKNKKEFIQWLLKDETKLYVCGESKKMLPQIQETIIHCMTEILGIEQIEAQNRVIAMKKGNKYIEDIWI